MKKTLTILLLVAIISLFTGCNNNQKESTNKETANESETIAVDDQGSEINSFIKVGKEYQLTPAIYFGGSVYVGDSTGLWTINGDEKESLSETSAEDITTNGTVILYRCGTGRGEDDNPDTRKNDYEIHQINCDGTEDKLLTKCSQDARPLMVYDGTLYFLDHVSTETVDYSLYSVDTGTGNLKAIVDYVDDDIAIGGRRIYFFSNDFDNDFGDFYYYDTETSEKTFVTSDFDAYKLYCDGESVYTIGRFEDEYDYSQCDLCAIKDDSYDVMAHITVDKNVEIQLIHNGLVYYRNNRSLYNQYDNYVLSLSDNKTKTLDDFLYDCKIIPMGKGVLYSTVNNYFYYDGNSLKLVNDLDPQSQTLLCTDGEHLYYAQSGEIKTAAISMSEDLPEAEDPTDPPEKTPSQESEYVYTEKEYKLPYTGSFLITGQEGSSLTYLAPRRLPQLKIESDDAKSINKDIHDKYDSTFEWYEDESIDYAVGRTDYVVYQNGDILSLVIETRSTDSPTSWFDVYNINVKTGKQLDNQELVKLSDVSMNEAYGLVYQEIEEAFNNVQGNVDETILDDVKTKSLSTNNIQSSKFYFNGDGKLSATYMYNWFAGGGTVGALSVFDASMK